MARLGGDGAGQDGGLGVRRHGGDLLAGAGQLEHPPRQGLRSPGEGRDAVEQLAPSQEQPQQFARARLAGRHQVLGEGVAMQGHGEQARRAGPVPGIAAGLHLQAGADQVDAARQHLAPGFEVERPVVARRGGEALGRRALDQLTVEAGRDPLVAGAAAQGDDPGVEGQTAGRLVETGRETFGGGGSVSALHGSRPLRPLQLWPFKARMFWA